MRTIFKYEGPYYQSLVSRVVELFHKSEPEITIDTFYDSLGEPNTTCTIKVKVKNESDNVYR